MRRLSDTAAGRAWTRWSRRERAFVAGGAAILAIALAWSFLWSPLQASLKTQALALREGEAALARTEARANDAVALARNARPVRTPDPKAAAARVVDERGLRPAVTALDAQEGRVRITFAAIPIPGLVALVDALLRDERLVVDEMALTARVEPGQVRAEFSLVRAGQ